MDQLGQPRDHRPRKGFWARFSEQETGPQKVLVGLAGTVTALATTVGGGYALVNVLTDDSQQVATDVSSPEATEGATDGPSSGSSGAGNDPSSPSEPTATDTFGITLRPGQTLVTQGSKEADALVHAFVDDPGARTDLDVVVLAEERLFPTPQWIMRLWYNCHGLPDGEPPGEDLCDSAMLVFDDADPSPTKFDNPLRIELSGIWADNRASGKGSGADGLEIFPVPASG